MRFPYGVVVEAGDAITEVANPEGRLVRLDTLAWNHVLEEHPELEPFWKRPC